jgi:hypothetical protein
MKLFRMRSLGMFGLGFLAGSAAGRGPWEKTEATLGQLKEKLNHDHGGIPTSTNGGKQSPQLTEI